MNIKEQLEIQKMYDNQDQPPVEKPAPVKRSPRKKGGNVNGK